MGTGYTRNDGSNNIANGNVINADDLDGEFDAIVDSFHSVTGHTHDGTTAEGSPITLIGPVQEYIGDSTALYPKTDATYDLGKSAASFSVAYVETINLAGTNVTSTAAQLNFSSDVTSALQAQLNGKQPLSSVLTATTASFLSADETKLDGIEASADVTDTANVTAAGALMDTELASITAVKATTGTFLTADQTKLDGISASATNTADPAITTNGSVPALSANISAAEVRTLIGAGTSSSDNVTHTGEVTGSTGLTIADNVVDAANLSVTGNGTVTEFLRSDADGTFTWATPVDTNTEYSVGDGGLTQINFTTDDNTKLDAIEAAADVTDTANVTAAGALMDTEVTNLAQVKAFDGSDYATAAQGTAAGAALPKAGGTMTGSITMTGVGTVDGRDVSVDGTKLDGIATGATNTVTNSTHTGEVTGSGALTIADDVVDAANLKVTGNGTTSQFLRSDGDGTFTWATPVDTNTNTQRAIHDTPVDGSTTTSISSNWAFDNVKTAVPTSALFTDTNTQRAIHDTPVNGSTTTSISSNWAFDNVKTPVPTSALFTDTNTEYTVGDGGLTQNNFTNADHTKLNGIEASADVTDAANVTSAGALMDSEVDSDIKTLSLPANTTISAFGRTLVDDAAASNARTTLGLGTAATTASTAYATAAQGVLAGTALQPAGNGSGLTNLTSGNLTGALPAIDGSSLTGIAAGATGGGNDDIFYENGQNVTTNYTITNGKNAMSAGPITIDSGVTVTVGAGETWTVV